MNRKIKNKIIVIGLILSCTIITAQQNKNDIAIQQKTTLIDVLNTASKHSLDVFKAKRQYGVNYWEFKSFKSSLLPKINFTAQPFTYNSALVERYDSEQNIDVFRQQQTINSYANLSISQNIGATVLIFI
ncbi:hypothetical protein OEG92_17425 [Polaribacter sejongensis]|uniref:hypothetical protein n=1 Tax=Polaribacter sejongensis TaxID=985043 RepID=UPI0035A5ABF3